MAPRSFQTGFTVDGSGNYYYFVLGEIRKFNGQEESKWSGVRPLGSLRVHRSCCGRVG